MSCLTQCFDLPLDIYMLSLCIHTQPKSSSILYAKMQEKKKVGIILCWPNVRMTSKPKKQNKDAFTTNLDSTRFSICFKNKKVIKLIKNTFYYRLTICTHYLQSCTKSTIGFLRWESDGKHRGLLNTREAQSVM